MRLDDTHKAILKDVAEKPKSVAKIAENLNLEISLVWHRIDTLKKNGYIQKERKGIITDITITALGKDKLLEASLEGQSSSHRAFNPKLQPLKKLAATHPIKIHKLALAFKLRTPLSPKEPAMVLKSAGLSYQPSGLLNQESGYSVYEDFTIFLTTEHLILYLPPIEISLLESPYLAFKQPIERAMDKATKLEGLLGQPLFRLDINILVAFLIFNENAMTNNEVAKNVLENKEKLNVIDSNGILRLKVDASPPRGLDLEAVFAQNAVADISKVEDQYLAVLTGKLDYEKDHTLLHGLIELADRNTRTLEEQNKFFTRHNELIAKLNDRIDALAPQPKISWWRRLFRKKEKPPKDGGESGGIDRFPSGWRG